VVIAAEVERRATPVTIDAPVPAGSPTTGGSTVVVICSPDP
jgi:hypothetical protein